MAPRLKVFVTSDGLTDYVVAVSSKAKALAAWGVRQDVFREGAAHETQDATLVEAATAQPGAVLRRPAGAPAKLAKLKPAKTTAPRGPTKAQRAKVAALEGRLADLYAAHDRAAAALDTRRDALDREEEALHAAHERQRAVIEDRLKAARRALG